MRNNPELDLLQRSIALCQRNRRGWVRRKIGPYDLVTNGVEATVTVHATGRLTSVSEVVTYIARQRSLRERQ